MTTPPIPTGGRIEDSRVTGQAELSEQDKLNLGIEALIVELILYHLSIPDRAIFEARRPIAMQVGQPELPLQTTAQHIPIGELITIEQVSYEDPLSPGKFVRDRLYFSAESGALANVTAHAVYDQTGLRSAGLRTPDLGVFRQKDLSLAKASLIRHGFLPPELQDAEAETSTPPHATGYQYQPGDEPL